MRIAALLCSLLALPVGAADLELHFIGLDTHGESILLRTPAGRAVLIDAGLPQGGPQVAAYLRQAGVRELDLVIATHDDPDHFGGVPLVLEAIPARAYWESPVRARGFRSGFRPALEQALAQRRVPRREVSRGDRVELEDGVTLEVLAPSRPWFTRRGKDDPNGDSLVLCLTHGETRILLMGDATHATEERLLATGTDLRCDLLKVAHHGIDTATSDAFLRATGARQAVICCAPGSVSVPAPDVLERLGRAGIRWHRTDRNGTVVVRSTGDPGALTVRAERGAADDAGPNPFPGARALLERYARYPSYAPPRAPFVGMIGRPLFHRASCPARWLIPGRQVVTFSTPREAREAGRGACAVCRP